MMTASLGGQFWMEGLNWLDKQEIPIVLDSEVVACCLDIEERVLPKQ